MRSMHPTTSAEAEDGQWDFDAGSMPGDMSGKVCRRHVRGMSGMWESMPSGMSGSEDFVKNCKTASKDVKGKFSTRLTGAKVRIHCSETAAAIPTISIRQKPG